MDKDVYCAMENLWYEKRENLILRPIHYLFIDVCQWCICFCLFFWWGGGCNKGN